MTISLGWGRNIKNQHLETRQVDGAGRDARARVFRIALSLSDTPDWKPVTSTSSTTSTNIMAGSLAARGAAAINLRISNDVCFYSEILISFYN